jgi:hypothetical protein
MNDLIWIGNTLYPRWALFAALGLIAMVVAAIAAVLTKKVAK